MNIPYAYWAPGLVDFLAASFASDRSESEKEAVPSIQQLANSH